MSGDMKTRIKQHETRHLYALAAVFFLGIVGTCAYVVGTTPNRNDSLSNSTAQGQRSTLPEVGTPIDSTTAREIAQAQKPHATVEKVEPVPVNGVVTTYSVQFSDGTKVDIAAKNGDVVSPKDTATSQDSGASDSSDTSTTSSTDAPPATDQPIDGETGDNPPSEPPVSEQNTPPTGN